MVSAGEMNQADVGGVLQTIAQQQTALFQQQAALLQVHGETVRSAPTRSLVAATH